METVIELCRNLFLLHRRRESTPARKVVLIDSEDDVLPFDRIQCEDLRMIGDAWLGMPREEGETLPRWSVFDTSQFTGTLDKICVLKATDWRADEIEFSLFGGHATDLIGRGKPISLQRMRRDPQCCANYIEVRNRAGRAIDNEAPQYARKTLSWNQQSHIEYETLMLPFMAEGKVQRLLQPISARHREI